MMTGDDDYTQPRHVEISFETRCSANLINAVQICHVHGPIIVLFPGTESRMTATVIAFLCVSGTLQDWDTLALINETGCEKSQTNMSTCKLVFCKYLQNQLKSLRTCSFVQLSWKKSQREIYTFTSCFFFRLKHETGSHKRRKGPQQEVNWVCCGRHSRLNP